MKLRQSLTDYFIMFCLYNSKNEEAYLELQDFLIHLKSKFNLAIYLVDSNNAEESLIQSLTPQQSDKQMTKPFFALAHPHIADIELLQSNDAFFIYKVMERYVNYYKLCFNSEKEETFNKITQLVNSFPIVIFIQEPHMSHFMELINNLKIDYRSFNIFK